VISRMALRFNRIDFLNIPNIQKAHYSPDGCMVSAAWLTV
jgi:hypothetical protein